jgi:cell wall-associated NlpC family hydrolase
MPRPNSQPAHPRSRAGRSAGLAGVTLLAVAAGLTGGAHANAAGDPPAVQGTAIQVLEPVAAAVTIGPVGATGTSGGQTAVPADGSVVSAAGWSDQPTPTGAVVDVQHGSLLGGAITFADASATAAVGGSGEPSATWSTSGLEVLGSSVTPVPGQTIELSDWGSLTIGLKQPLAQAGGTGGGVAVTTLTVTLTQAYDNLPAGTRILIGQASATAGASQPGSSPGPTQIKVAPPTGSKHRRRRGEHHHRPGRSGDFGRRLQTHPRTLPKSLRLRIVAWAASQIGWPYVWGGENEREGGFDCSGLVDFAYDSAGAPLPGRPTAEVLWQMSQPISRAQLLPGDLVFLVTHTGYAYHVGIYAGHDQVIVAPHSGSRVRRESLSETPWQVFGRLWIPGLRPQHRHTAPVAEATTLWRAQAPATGTTPPAVPVAAHRPRRHHRRHGTPHSQWQLDSIWVEPARAMILPIPVPLTPGVWG